MRAISTNEFTQLLRTCLPPSGNVRKLGVAFSGGPDSLTLLHLLSQLAHSSLHSPGLPNEIYAITVDHQLQAASNRDTARCEALARKLAVRHRVRRIEWGTGIYPRKPAVGEHFEAIARDCRYRLLFDTMTELELDCLALGHHLDDQIETMIMRYTKGTRGLGLAGMRACRRWGMGASGSQDPLRWFGLEGMNKWVLRPLLSTPKARCVATCHAANLDFVEDKTNFQPDLTPRNAIRALLSNHGEVMSHSSSPDSSPERGTIEDAIRSLLAHDTVHSDPTVLSTQLGRHALSFNLERDKQDTSGKDMLHLPKSLPEASLAETFLETVRVAASAPFGTFYLDPSIEAPEAPEAQRGIILRILRYVSPLPWGSPRAEAGRRVERLDRVRRMIWGMPPQSPCSFTVGGQVLWTFLPNTAKRKDQYPVWLVSRLPPSRNTSLEVCLNDAILRGKVSTLLWDGRFRITLYPALIPRAIAARVREGIGRLSITPQGHYCTPTLSLRLGSGRTRSFTLVDGNLAAYPILLEAFQVEWSRKLCDKT